MEIKKWVSDNDEADRRKIEKLEKEIHSKEVSWQGTVVSTEQEEELANLRAALWSAYRAEERAWQQKSRFLWLTAGDRNTKFFHLVANVRRKRNLIKELHHQGQVIHQPKELQNYIFHYFKEVYTEITALALEDLDCNFRTLSEGSVEGLQRPFSQGEVFEVIKNSKGDKAPGPDGFNFCFIQHQWEMLKNPIMEMMSTFYETAALPRGLNASFITLIQKCEGANNLKQFRPISLVGCIYKILAKVLANRLKQVLGEVIGGSQFTFMEGRKILDCSLIANEAIDWLKTSRSGGVCLKVDFEKAYDTVDWEFLQFVMKKMGFGEL